MRNPLLALDVWTDPRRKSAELEKAWERFVSSRDTPGGVRPLIVASWQRCAAQGVQPLAAGPSLHLPAPEVEERWLRHPIGRDLEPWLQELQAVSADSSHLVVVTDASGHILRIEGDRRVQLKAQEMNFIAGANWSEGAAGTNAIGTVLATGQPVQVFSAEHFCRPVHRWTCSAAPIRDPATGAMLGVIDLTGLREAVHPHSLSVVMATAQAVEQRLRERLQMERFQVAEQYLQALGHNPRQMLAAVDRGGAVIQAAPVFREEGWVGAGGELAGKPIQEILGCATAVWEAEGPRGRYRFSSQVILRDGVPIGALIRMEPPGGGGGGGRTAAITATRYSFMHLIGRAPAFLEAVASARTAAGSDFPVLIAGESGTGKEVLAQAIHVASRRAGGPFVAVNCGAVPKELLASEFFGYEGGSFTGAVREGRPGKFEQASGGTIFLDEIGEMPLDAQAHLLRVLEEREVVRLGGRAPVRLDVRVIAATNRDLTAAIQTGAFRLDLFYRLNVISLRVPPLRERPGDAGILAARFLHQACLELNRVPMHLTAAAVAALEAYDWPGNVRELRNVVYRLALAVSGPEITAAHLERELAPLRAARSDPKPPPPATGRWQAELSSPSAAARPHGPGAPLPVVPTPVADLERSAFVQAWQLYGGQAEAVARALGISRATVYRKAHQYGVARSPRNPGPLPGAPAEP